MKNNEELYNNLIENFNAIMYGGYGTSPRTGWLELKNKKEIVKFIDNLTRLSKEGD